MAQVAPPPAAAPTPPPAAASAAPPPAAPPAPLLPKGAISVPPVTNQHSMAKRAKSGFRVPAAFPVVPLSSVPKTFRSALADSN
jgi:hypothetical protein